MNTVKGVVKYSTIAQKWTFQCQYTHTPLIKKAMYDVIKTMHQIQK